MASEANSFKVTLLFPISDNEGQPFSEEIWSWWRDELTRLIFGFTQMGVVRAWWEGRGLAQGWWRGQSDQSRWLVIVVKTETEVNKIREFLRVARVRFSQDKMYFECHPVHFEEVS